MTNAALRDATDVARARDQQLDLIGMSVATDWTDDLRADGVFANRGEHAPKMRTHDFIGHQRHNDCSDTPAGKAKASSASPVRLEAAANGQQALTLPRSLLRGTIRYIHSNLDSRLTWKELATAVGIDEFKFGRAFKMSTGMTPHQYVTRCRLRRALKLLHRGEMAIADIALEVGCSCQSHLTALFGRYIGTTPGAFRNVAKQSRRLLGSGDKAVLVPPAEATEYGSTRPDKSLMSRVIHDRSFALHHTEAP